MANLGGMVQRIAAASGWLEVPAAFGQAPPGGEGAWSKSSGGARPVSTGTALPGGNLTIEPGSESTGMLFNVAPLLLISSTIEDGREVWLAEAEHRANNFAQLAASIAALRRRRVNAPSPAANWIHAEALARAYARLNDRSDGKEGQATAALLDQIATGLVATFAEAVGSVRLSFDCQEVLLAHAHKRALALILSELIVNALKYAFPARRPGTIEVSLRVTGSMAKLVVADDGVGSSGVERTGQGKVLLEQMAAMLSGKIIKERIATGGLRVAVCFPAGADFCGDAVQCGERASRTRTAPFNGTGTAFISA